MSPELVLHIGISKTGSTSIQRWLADVCQPFRGDVFVPDNSTLPLTIAGNHKGLVLFGGSSSVWRSRHAARLFKEMSVARVDRPTFLATYEKGLARCARIAAENRCRLLLSNEHLSERLDKSDITSFTDRLRPLFSSLTLIAYLREQSKQYVSLYGEVIKHGSRVKFADFCNLEWVHRRFEYYTLLANWADEGWIVRPRIYHESSPSEAPWSAISDFESQVWPTRPDDSPVVASTYRINKSYCPESYEMMACLNSNHLPSGFRRHLLSSIDRVMGRPGRFVVRNARILEEIRIRHAESNRRTAREYFGREALFPTAPAKG